MCVYVLVFLFSAFVSYKCVCVCDPSSFKRCPAGTLCRFTGSVIYNNSSSCHRSCSIPRQLHYYLLSLNTQPVLLSISHMTSPDNRRSLKEHVSTELPPTTTTTNPRGMMKRKKNQLHSDRTTCSVYVLILPKESTVKLHIC